MSKKQNKKILLRCLTVLAMVALVIAVVNIYKMISVDASDVEKQETSSEETQVDAAQETNSEETQADAVQETTAEETISAEQMENEAKKEVLTQYTNLAIVNNTNFLNVRDTPSTDGNVIGKLAKYNAMDVLEDMGNGWYHIQSGEVDGYLSSEFVVMGTEAEELAVQNCFRMMEVKLPTIDVHSAPSTDAPIWSQLRQSEKYIVKEKVGDWYHLDFTSEDAYVMASDGDVSYYLSEAQSWSALDSCSEQRRKLIEYGMQYMGVPYVWGGTEFATGVDCSGFTLLCFLHVGITIPRVSYNQANEGITVNSLSEAKPGDLLFYADANNRINHVAIYIGDKKILQAANSLHQVTISRYNYNTEPVLIKNIFGD